MTGAALFNPTYEPVQVLAAKPVLDLEGYVREFMAVLDPDGKIPMPSVRVVKRTGVDWEGIIYTSTHRGPDGTAYSVTGRIDLQAHVAGVERSARRILAHECCHLAQYWALSVGLPKEQSRANLAQNDAQKGHGVWFLTQAAIINSVYGPDFVTPHSDESYERRERAPIYYLMLKETKRPYIRFSVAGRPSSTQLEYIRKAQAAYPPGDPDGEVRMVRAPEKADLVGADPIGKGWSKIQDSATESLAFIQDLWDNGENILTTMAQKATSFPFWVVIESRSGEFMDFWMCRVLTPKLKQEIGDMTRWSTVKLLKTEMEDLRVLPVFGKGRGMIGQRLQRMAPVDAKDLWNRGTVCTNAEYDKARA